MHVAFHLHLHPHLHLHLYLHLHLLPSDVRRNSVDMIWRPNLLSVLYRPSERPAPVSVDVVVPPW